MALPHKACTRPSLQCWWRPSAPTPACFPCLLQGHISQLTCALLSSLVTKPCSIAGWSRPNGRHEDHTFPCQRRGWLLRSLQPHVPSGCLLFPQFTNPFQPLFPHAINVWSTPSQCATSLLKTFYTPSLHYKLANVFHERGWARKEERKQERKARNLTQKVCREWKKERKRREKRIGKIGVVFVFFLFIFFEVFPLWYLKYVDSLFHFANCWFMYDSYFNTINQGIYFKFNISFFNMFLYKFNISFFLLF